MSLGRLLRLCILAVVALAPTACSGGSGQQSATASPSPASAALAAAASTTPAVTPSVSVAPAASAAAALAPTAAAAPAATVTPAASVRFSDIGGNFAAAAITQEAALGLFGSKSGAFKPDATLTRAQYVDWLVTANNIYFKDTPQGQIRLADPNSDQTFVDVPKSSAYFSQIEGMADAGYVIGVDKNHFAPDRLLTREELVAIQTSRYSGGAAFQQLTSASGMFCVRLVDAAQVSKPYWGALNYDQCTGFNGQDDLHRIFGSIRTFHPQRPVTRAEAAVALQKIAGRTAPQ